MNLPEICIRRPVMTTLLMAAFILFGIVAYRDLPVSELPSVDFPTISVSANLPGASPETMAAAVATPLEGQFSTIPGLDSMNSTSGQGTTSITLQFSLDKNIDAAAQEVQSAIAGAQRRLPSAMPNPPSFRKINPADSPILFIALSSKTLELSKVNEYAETQLAQRLSTIDGVAQVQVFGSQKYAVRIEANLDKLAARNMGIDELSQAISRANVNAPLGVIDGDNRSFSIKDNGQLTNAAAYRELIVAWKDGAAIRLGDVANAIDGVENRRMAAWNVDERAIVLAVNRQPGTNTVKTVAQIRKLLPKFQESLPASVNMTLLYDRSVSIKESIDEVEFTLVLSGFLVVLVILLFLRNLSATLIPAIALPISVVGTFALMYLFGFSLDNLSLLALTLSVGFVVDDAIVMLENIMRHIEKGEKPLAAAMIGGKEIGFTIISMTISLIAVFIPILFMGGIVGRLFFEFAVTISSAILVSGIVSLTLTPMLCSRYLKLADHKKEAKHGRAFLFFEHAFEALLNAYKNTLSQVMKHPKSVILLFFAMLLITVYLFIVVSKDFIPTGDSGQISATVEGPQDASFSYMIEHQQAIAKIISENQNVASFMSSVGGGGGRSAQNTGFLSLMLKPKHARPSQKSPEEIIAELRPKLAQVAGVRVFLQNPPTIRIGGQSSSAQYQYTLQSSDLEALYTWTNTLLQKVRGINGLTDVTSNLNNKSSAVLLTIDRDKIATLGVEFSQVEDALQSAFSSRQISTIYGQTSQYQVILEVAPEFQTDPSVLSRVNVRSNATNGNKLIPLDTIATFTRQTQALNINHLGQLPAVTISFNLLPGVSLGDAVASIRAMERDISLPATVTTGMQGTAQAFASSQQGLGMLLLIAIFVVYLVLGVLYESFIHPLTILSGLPSAALGALLTLIIFRVDLNLYSFVGVILLIGIVKKNAIMMIDFALEKQRGENIAAFEAIFEAALVRFRPIMMTTMAAIIGTLPIALGVGAGAEVRRPLGLAVVGGLLFSQLLTLYLTPVIYVYLDKFTKRERAAHLQIEEA